ncbi:cohesin subunit SA-2-like isoform X2 [Tubulanus polymorphus]
MSKRGGLRPRRKSKDIALENLCETMEPQYVMEPDLQMMQEAGDNDSDFEDPSLKIRQVVRQVTAEETGKRAAAGGGGGNRKRRKEGEMGDGQEKVRRAAEDGSMFEIVKAGKMALQTVVDDWIETYKQDRDAALLELIQFFIQSSGCRGKITPHMYAELQHAELIRKMTEEFDEESGDYPLIMSGPVWKKFKTNFVEFVTTLVKQCQYSIIYDQYMMDNVISLLTGLTDSQVRAFRHTSTLAAMKLMTALVDVALGLSVNLDYTQRQYEAERQKTSNKRASERLEMLMQKRQEMEENQEEIRNMLTYIFKGVFVHRYRDSIGEIRSICMAEIGVWMKKYPNMFLDDGYLKYVGWTLYDRSGEVRHVCLKGLHNLYESEELAPKLELFTNRFKDRIVEMTLDKEYDVAVQAVKLVISILRYSENVLSDKDCENVYELVYSSHRQVAQAAGEFLNAKLFQKDPELTRNLPRTKKGKKRSENTPLIRDLVQFFIESELHEHAAYLVDSLWEINDMMKDWECMTDLLLEEPGRGEEPLDDRQELSLIEIMVCCVKQAATWESPVGRGPNKKLTTKEIKQLHDDKARLTEHFIVSLPQLVVKYVADAEKLSNLLQIPQHFDLEIYTTSRLEKHLELLLKYIQEIVDKHTSTEVLEACSKCYEAFCNQEFAIAGKCIVTRSTLIDGLIEKYREAYQDYFQEGEEADDEEIFSLVASLKRIYAFYGCHDLTKWGLWVSFFHIVKQSTDPTQMQIPVDIVCRAIACCSMAIMWNLHRLDETNPDKGEMKMLNKRLDEFMMLLQDLLYHQMDKINEEAFITICDLLIVFSKHLESVPALKPLIYEPDKNIQAQLGSFLSDKVFVEDDDDDIDENVKIEELHNRRNFLASFCKLVVYNVVHIRTAADMFKHYMRFYNDYGDIIKATLGKSREINKVSTAKTLALSLTSLFKELQAEQGINLDRMSDGYQSIKELARRFALSFGLDQVKNRQAVAAMHKEGILFSLNPLENPEDPRGPPPNLAFLEILCEFTNKLMKQDKRVVVMYLDKHLAGGMPSTRSEDWAPLLTYRNSLVQGDTEPTMNPTMKNPPGRPPKGGKKRGKQQHDVYEPQTPAPGEPLSASTAIKRPRTEGDLSDEATVAMTIAQMSQGAWLDPQQADVSQQQQQPHEQTYSRRSNRVSQSQDESPDIGQFSSPSQQEKTASDTGRRSYGTRRRKCSVPQYPMRPIREIPDVAENIEIVDEDDEYSFQ